MKHNIKFKRLSRDTKHRIALCKNLSKALLIYKKIRTTKAKSEAAIFLVNKLITKFKEIPYANYRQKVLLVKKYVENHNRDNIHNIISNIESLDLSASNHVSRLNLFTMRQDTAQMVLLSLI